MAKNLSKFVFKQLVYDYLVGDLEGKELEKFKAKLNAEGDCYDYVELVKKSQSYMADLSKLNIHEQILIDVSSYKEDNLFYLFNPFDFSIPGGVKIAFKTLATIGVLLFLYYFLPLERGLDWLKVKNNSQQVTDLKLNEGYLNTNLTTTEVRDVKIETELPNITQIQLQPVKDKNVKIKKEISVEVKPKKAPVVSDQPAIEADVVTNNDLEFVTKINEIKYNKNIEKKETTEFMSAQVVQPKKKGPQGTLFRIYMSINKLDQVTPKIIEIIKRMGGEKAGEKNLGYMKPKGRYFHFKLPLSSRDDIFSELGGFGRVKIDKEQHWTKMPEGISRIILWVEDLDLKAQRQRGR